MHLAALPLQLLDPRDLVGRRDAGAPGGDAERLRRMLHRGLAVAGQTARPRCRAAFSAAMAADRIGAQLLAHRKDMALRAAAECDDGHFGIAAQDFIGQRVGAAEGRAAEPHLDTVDRGAHAPARLLDRAGQRRLGPCGARDRGGNGMAAGQREAAGEVEHVGAGWFAALTTSRSGSVSVPVLSNTTVSTSATRSIASPELSSTPDAEHRARGHRLHRGDGKPERAGTGDDQHGNRGDDRIVPAGAEGDPAEHGQQRGDMHHRRIEPRGAVGELHVARARLQRVVAAAA